MGGYLLRRVAESLATVLAVLVVTFALVHLMPQNLAVLLAGPRASSAQIAHVAKVLGLTLPLYEEFWLWLRAFVLSGAYLGLQLGPQTLALLALASLLALILAFGIGYVQALRPRSLFERVSTALAYVFYTFPSFWIGLVLIYVFTLYFTWLPPTGPTVDPASHGFSHWIAEMVLPVLTLALTTVATWSAYLRGAIEEALRSDYVRTARAKGLPERMVITRHVLRSAVPPLITVTGMSLPTLFNNLIAIEAIFAIQGLGSVTYWALHGHQYGLAIGLIVVISAITVFGNLLADILLAMADPRIRFA